MRLAKALPLWILLAQTAARAQDVSVPADHLQTIGVQLKSTPLSGEQKATIEKLLEARDYKGAETSWSGQSS